MTVHARNSVDIMRRQFYRWICTLLPEVFFRIALYSLRRLPSPRYNRLVFLCRRWQSSLLIDVDFAMMPCESRPRMFDKVICVVVLRGWCMIRFHATI